MDALLSAKVVGYCSLLFVNQFTQQWPFRSPVIKIKNTTLFCNNFSSNFHTGLIKNDTRSGNCFIEIFDGRDPHQMFLVGGRLHVTMSITLNTVRVKPFFQSLVGFPNSDEATSDKMALSSRWVNWKSMGPCCFFCHTLFIDMQIDWTL